MEASMQMSTLMGRDAQNRQWQLVINFERGLKVSSIECEGKPLARDMKVVGPWPQPCWYRSDCTPLYLSQPFAEALWKPGIEKSKFIAHCQANSWLQSSRHPIQALFEAWVSPHGAHLRLSYSCSTEALIGWSVPLQAQENRLRIHSLIDEQAKVYSLIDLQQNNLLAAGTDEIVFASQDDLYEQFYRHKAIRGVGGKLQVKVGNSGWKAMSPNSELSLLVHDHSLVAVSASDPRRPKLSASSLELCFFQDYP